jgi:cell division protein FtsA
MSEYNDIVVGLDIGTTKVCTVISQVRESGLEVIGVGSAPSYGLRKGVIVNIDATVDSITKSVEDAEIMAGVEVESVYAGIAGNHIKGINTRGMVAISSRNREISSADVERAIDAARTVAIPADREIIHIFNQEFKVDDQDGVKDPVGMSGGRLEVEVHIVTGAVTSSENIIKSVERAGYKVNDIVLQSYASALACMGEEDKEMGEVLVDIGGGTIDILMYINGSIWHSAVLALGGNNITNDIAIGMRVPTTFAEEIKKKHAVAFREMIRDNVEVELSSIAGKESRKCRLSDLTEITEPRMIELMGLVRKEIEMTGFADAGKVGFP